MSALTWPLLVLAVPLGLVAIFGSVVAGLYLMVKLNRRPVGTGSGGSTPWLVIAVAAVAVLVAIPVLLGVFGLLGMSTGQDGGSSFTSSPEPAYSPLVDTPGLPYVVGLQVADAQPLLSGLGLAVTVHHIDSGPGRPGQVVAQDPEAGGPVPADSTIVLTVRTGAPGPSPTS